MKKSDILTVIMVATVGTVVAAILCNMLLGDPNDKMVSFKNIQVVEPGLAIPDPEVFNMEAINPTVEVYVGNCVDQDQDGKLSDEELAVCGRGIPHGGDVNNNENSQQEQAQGQESEQQNTQDNTQDTVIIIQEGE